jgi:hypothetical protein
MSVINYHANRSTPYEEMNSSEKEYDIHYILTSIA